MPNTWFPASRTFSADVQGVVPLAVASNAERANVDFVLDGMNLRQYFPVALDASRVQRPKPFPDIYLLAAQELGIAPQNCIVFEDSQVGISAGRQAGTRVVGILTGGIPLNHVDLAVTNFSSPELEPWLAAQQIYLRILALVSSALLAAGQDLVTLEQAQSRTGRDFTAVFEGKTVRVRGQVSASPIWALGSYYLPIRDSADHGLILAGEEKTFTDLAPGDWIEATGKIGSRGGLPLLEQPTVKKTGQGPPPPTKDLSLSELSGLRNLGLMIRTTAVVSGTGDNTGGKVLLISDHGYSMTVFLPKSGDGESEHLSSGMLRARPGDRVRIMGLATQYCLGPPYNRDFQVLLTSAEDVEILETAAFLPPLLVLGVIGGLAALAILWWVRERRLKEQRESWRAFYGLSEDLIASATPAEIAEKLCSVLPSVIDATSASLYLYDRRTQSLQRIPTSAEPEPMAVPLDDPPEGMSGAAVAAFRNRALLSVPDARRNPLVKVGAKMNLPRSAMFVPLLSQQEILGVLQADNARDLGYFTPDEQASTQHLANQAAASLKLQEQRAMREQIFRSEKLAATGQLISGVASELRSPLEGIVKLMDSLTGLEDGPGAGLDLNGLYVQSRRVAEIVGRLVSFGTGSGEVDSSIDLNSVLAGLIKFREPEWKGLGIRGQNRLAPAARSGGRFERPTGTVISQPANSRRAAGGSFTAQIPDSPEQSDGWPGACRDRLLDRSGRPSGRSRSVRAQSNG